MNRIRSALNRIGTELLSEKKFALSAGHSAESPLSLGRDLLSVLSEASTSIEPPNATDQLSLGH